MRIKYREYSLQRDETVVYLKKKRGKKIIYIQTKYGNTH